jgi:putative flippase GtrA
MNNEAKLDTRNQLTGFIVVGAIGFLIDASVLSFLVLSLKWHYFAARLCSFGIAATVTWVLNRRAVFSMTQHPRKEYAGYIAVQVFGALVNLGIFVLVIKLIPKLAAWPIVPLACGASLALIFNFVMLRNFVFDRSDQLR